MKKNNKKGFTLVELVIVVAVMAILVAVAIPTIGSIKGSAEDSVAKSNAKTIESIVKLADANADGTGSVGMDVVAKAIYEAKLGITSTSTAKVYYYNPDNGTVYIAKDATKAGANKWTITFGKVTLSAASGDFAAGDYDGVQITRAKTGTETEDPKVTYPNGTFS